MKYKNNFVIHSMKQLIDINKGLTDFNANISITSQNENDVFDIVIVTQQNLDDIDFTLNSNPIIIKPLSHPEPVKMKLASI